MELLKSIIKQFYYYKQLGQKAIDQCSDEGLFEQYNEESNSIAIIVKHLNGNMLSRWTEFLTTDGEKEWRDRDGEFEATIKSRRELQQKYDQGWDCLLNTLESLNEADLQKTVYIRNLGHSALEAINRQLAHVPYHIGQIVYLSRMYTKENWQSLSIPKGNSKQYNANTLIGGKRTQHYTQQFLEEE